MTRKTKKYSGTDAASERFNDAMGDLVEAQEATYKLDPDPPDYATRNRALEEAWAAYQAADCPCSEKPSGRAHRVRTSV
jgi:hypothetical protein